jgi:transcriptional regulator with XRE-family HTH domain
MDKDEELRLQRLGLELAKIREERRKMTQKELASLSGVSDSTIKLIEAGKSTTKHSTLRLLAQGLATDLDGRIDYPLAEAFYARLMDAWGALPKTRPSTAPAGGISRDAFIKEMEQRIGQPLAIAMSTVAWDYDGIPEAHRKILEAAILGLAGAHKSEESE